MRQHTAKHDESRTQEYLYAAARGDTGQIQQVCLWVQDPVTRLSKSMKELTVGVLGYC